MANHGDRIYVNTTTFLVSDLDRKEKVVGVTCSHGMMWGQYSPFSP